MSAKTSDTHEAPTTEVGSGFALNRFLSDDAFPSETNRQRVRKAQRIPEYQLACPPCDFPR